MSENKKKEFSVKETLEAMKIMLEEVDKFDQLFDKFLEMTSELDDKHLKHTVEYFICTAILTRALERQPLCIAAPEASQAVLISSIILAAARKMYPNIDPAMIKLPEGFIEATKQDILDAYKTKPTSANNSAEPQIPTRPKNPIAEVMENLTAEEIQELVDSGKIPKA